MKYLFGRTGGTYFLAIICAVSAFTFSADAQRQSKPARRAILTDVTTSTILAPAASSTTQCQNGKASAPAACSGTAYKTGALNKNNSHYAEGDSIPYQILLTAPANSTGNTVTLNWDSTKGGAHAFDYLTSYFRTETVLNGNDPCTGTGADCSFSTTFPIPLDPNVSGGGVSQTAGVFTLFGGTITGVSGYTLSGSWAGDSSESITVTFSMGPTTGMAVLAVGGHAATRKDWGNGFASVNISGSPFHFDTGGNQLQVSVGALTAPATINIVKLVHNFGGSHYNPNASFSFRSAGGPLGNFSLIDNNPAPNLGGVQSATTTTFGTAFTVTEDIPNPPNGYSFTQGACSVDAAGFPNTSSATANIGVNRVATITAGEGNIITCTYENANGAPTAAKVTIGGRVTTTDGRGIGGVRIVLTDDKGVMRTALTNSMGYYAIDSVEVGRAYVVAASSRSFTFMSQLVGLTDARGDINFVAN